ncbi:MAG: GDSL-type esterase/lipase family protein, partial [bacterium]|nr:GDSL-type esterase/lipase family protein [bacterium]
MLKDSAKTILCYGDSNTWGAIPSAGQRYPRSVRWTGVLQNLLGDDYEVLSEGLCGRTFVASDPAKSHRIGITHLQALLETHDPIDFLIIMLGTNDVKSTYNLSPEDIA